MRSGVGLEFAVGDSVQEERVEQGFYPERVEYRSIRCAKGGNKQYREITEEFAFQDREGALGFEVPDFVTPEGFEAAISQ